jgi:hypothetical protein
MSNTSPQNGSYSVDDIFAGLNQRDIEQFYASYQQWHLHQQIATLQTRIDDLYLQIFDITERMQTAQPSAIAFATLARLQANGVNDIELLDRMLERGENWLDQTMQRLDYCEQLDDFIRDDYTQWCRHALEGAYDWIGSIQDASTSVPAEEPVAVEAAQVEATTELFLQKLNSDEDEDETSMLETTLKRPAVTLSSSEEAAPIPVVADTLAAAEAISPLGEPEPVVEETPPGDVIPASAIDAVQENADVVEGSHQVEVSFASETLVESTAEPEQTDVPIEQESAPAIEETSLEETAPPLEEHIPSIEESVAAEVLLTSPNEQPGSQEFIAPEESVAVDDSSNGQQPALQEDAQPATEEETRPASEEHVPVSESESTMQEHVMLEESPPVESSPLPGIEQPTLQESVEIVPAQEEPSLTLPEPPQQIEEPVPSEVPAAESEKLEANVQAGVPQDGEPHPQNTVATKRPNFIMRLLRSIWGS